MIYFPRIKVNKIKREKLLVNFSSSGPVIKINLNIFLVTSGFSITTKQIKLKLNEI